MLKSFFRLSVDQRRRSNAFPKGKIAQAYRKFRWRIMESTFIGYAFFYLVRNNLAPVSKEFGEAVGYSKSEIGDFLAVTAIAYGVVEVYHGIGLGPEQSPPVHGRPGCS